MTTHLVYGDSHAHPNFNNDRADLISRAIQDIKPDVVVNIGDNADMASLSTYEKGLRQFYGRSYKEDINAHLDFDRRVWEPVKRLKKKLPFRVFCIGNHEQRIEKALDRSPELQGAISMKDLGLEQHYDTIVPYAGSGTPGTIVVDGITYAHYVVAGVSGRALSSLHMGYGLVSKKHRSVTVGHQHVYSHCSQSIGVDKFIHGLCLPCMTDYEVDWAGNITDLWNRGIVVKRNVHDGDYDLEVISLDQLRKKYGEPDDVRGS